MYLFENILLQLKVHLYNATQILRPGNQNFEKSIIWLPVYEASIIVEIMRSNEE